MNGARGIRSEKLIENQYIEGYAKFLGSKRVEWEEERNVEQVWEQVRQAMIHRERELFGSMKVGRKHL